MTTESLHDSQLAHGEDGNLIPICEFDYDSVEVAFKKDVEALDISEFNQKEIDAALKLTTHMLKWIVQSGMRNMEGASIRSWVIAWVFLKELRPLTLTQLATGLGKHKQSIGRWVDAFKRDFPRIRTPHMK